MIRWLARAAARELCSGHDYSYWQGVDGHPSYRRWMSGILLGRTDWRTYPFPCHEFRRCSKCGNVEVREGHSWGSPQAITSRRRLNVDDNYGPYTTTYIQYCLRSGYGSTTRP